MEASTTAMHAIQQAGPRWKECVLYGKAGGCEWEGEEEESAKYSAVVVTVLEKVPNAPVQCWRACVQICVSSYDDRLSFTRIGQ